MLPKATAFVMALKITARVRLDSSRNVSLALRQDVVKLERDADLKQHRQRDNIGEVDHRVRQRADFHRDHSSQVQRGERQEYIGDTTKRSGAGLLDEHI
jgi:hypothetical protein